MTPSGARTRTGTISRSPKFSRVVKVPPGRVAHLVRHSSGGTFVSAGASQRATPRIPLTLGGVFVALYQHFAPLKPRCERRGPLEPRPVRAAPRDTAATLWRDTARAKRMR